MDLQAFRCNPSLHPYSFSGLLLHPGSTLVLGHTGSASVLGQSGSTSNAPRCCSSLVSSASCVTRFHRLSVCALGYPNYSSFSAGHSPVVACQITIMNPPSVMAVILSALWVFTIWPLIPSSPPWMLAPFTPPWFLLPTFARPSPAPFTSLSLLLLYLQSPHHHRGEMVLGKKTNRTVLHTWFGTNLHHGSSYI
ncbi:hypothetical protein DPX16_5926 [Anabarilius grahami]|uniref:Uncharacterized protein n=1 Tax=Anabarilius grahami TaxID=495550 RepID=A0A3N0Y320_ANAGA|nr:hypothetical protein DPX16_5926 [Anabarilius grahami]